MLRDKSRIARLPLKAQTILAAQSHRPRGAVYGRIDCAIRRMLRLMSLDAEAGGTLALPFTR
jgi:hypothetical protein